ncbi:MAG: aminoglycoside phosphotransferase family protein, partial [Rhodobiaceae bacterium]|nr:aminoglycoside phosphotransferase family protein [Rhodobiaceae bacterium]
MSAFRDHPSGFDVAYLAQVFDQPVEALSGFSFEPVGTGQVGDSYRVTLDWAAAPAGVPSSLIAKCPAGDATSRETARNMHLYEIETQFYRRF